MQYHDWRTVSAIKNVRMDGHGSNLIPISPMTVLSAGGVGVITTPVPDNAIAFMLSWSSGSVRYTFDGETQPSSTIGHNIQNTVIPCKPGSQIRVSFSTAATGSLTFFEGV